WLEFGLWKDLRNFTLLAFVSSTRRHDRITMETLATKIINQFEEIAASNGEDFRVYSKLHNLTHYSQLTARFGPPYLHATWRFERKHQYAKQMARRVRNFCNI